MAKQVQTKLIIKMRQRNRATTFFRPLLILPMLIFVGTFTTSNTGAVSIAFTLAVPVLLALVFRNKYPSYIYGFNHSFMELQNRIAIYALYLTDVFPTIEKNRSVVITLPEIRGGKALNRWLPLVKWFLAIPLYVVGIVYLLVTIIYTVLAWFSIVFTGKYPKFAIDFVVGTVDYWNRVSGYAFILVTDEYPSFSLTA
ncbi:MAG: DUF4389 domain-containing protein [Candidatus Nanopelagicales bacterium]|jgi:hypothetical protein|nr:DUF4389 domain-containing protein [Candidatus Nanopelagicales bacterium]MBJ7393380.1 DUF4389 domain-containing protein [Candidatus Nanopelagicales bacterium]